MGSATFGALLLALFLSCIHAAPDRPGRAFSGQQNVPRPAPYVLPSNNRSRTNDSRQDRGGTCRDDPWQLPRIPRLSDPQAGHGRQAATNDPPPQPIQPQQGASRWEAPSAQGAQGIGNCRPAQRGPQRALQAAVVVNDRRFVTSAPEVHLPNVQRRFFSPQPAAPRRPTPEEIRERQNIETRRTVAHNTWQQYLRDRVITLGYRAAGEAWPRSTTFAAGQFTRDEVEEQSQYARWCRDTIIGFERYFKLAVFSSKVQFL
jgi:hypothetical protein